MPPTSNNGATFSEHDALLTQHSNNPLIVDLEERNRRRLCLALVIFSFVLALVGALAVASASHRRQLQRANRRFHASAVALHRLNHHPAHMHQTITELCESTVLLLRHCEKSGPDVTDANGNEHCSYIGHERSHYVASLFGTRWPIPTLLYALSPERRAKNEDSHWNFREYETLRPTSEKFSIGIDIVEKNGLQHEIFEMLNSGSLCGKIVVVSWKHELLPELATRLGCGPLEGCPDEYPEDSFDQVWQLKYVFHPPPLVKTDDERTIIADGSGKKNNSTGTPQGKTGDSETSPDHHERMLRKNGKGRSKHGWNVYNMVQQQNFDPLAFSYASGEYSSQGGATEGGMLNADSTHRHGSGDM
jgi:hypothetical protein